MLLTVVLLGLLVSQATTPGPAPAASPLLESARSGDLTRVRELLSRGAAVDAADRRGLTPLMWAAASGNTEVARLLLDSGAAVDRRAADGSTALMLASANGFTDIVRALVLKGADVTAAKGGVRARQLALERGHAEVVTLLDQAEALGRRLLQAASEGHDMVVRQVLALGAPVNMTDERGTTALMIAARNGDLGILQALLSRGADGSIRDMQGRTVFDWAEPSASTSKFVVAFLMERGVSKDAPRVTAPPPSPQVKASLATLATTLGRVPPASAAVQTAQRRANAALSQLQALSAKWPADSPDDYRDNLAGYISALESALKAGNAETLAATVDAVAEDLEVKLEHCTKSGGRLGGSVVVRVRTVQGGAESRSWQVFYMPRVFEAASNAAPDLFPQLSSPTEETLVPGRYVMWVRDPATARLGERTLVKVGEGRKELLLDLPVPAALPR
jgi:ankyrin repeat protein